MLYTTTAIWWEVGTNDKCLIFKGKIEMKNKYLYLSIIFHIEAKSDKSKENMKNKIRKQLAEVLHCDKVSVQLNYDNYTNSYSYIEEPVKERFEDKVVFLISTLQKLGYSYLISGNLDNHQIDLSSSNCNISGVHFIQGYLAYDYLEE